MLLLKFKQRDCIRINNNMKTKLEQFINRNKKRNAHLYDDNLINGQDYILCPVSKERLSMIKSSYIIRVLGMTVE